MSIHSFFQKIENDALLATLLNSVSKELDSYKVMTLPEFYNPTEDTGDYTASMFYRLLVFENYAHALVKRLLALKKDIEIYNNEFNGSWRYYALAAILHITWFQAHSYHYYFKIRHPKCSDFT